MAGTTDNAALNLNRMRSTHYNKLPLLCVMFCMWIHLRYSVSFRAKTFPFGFDECGTVPNPQLEAERLSAHDLLPEVYKYPPLWLKIILASAYGVASAIYCEQRIVSLGTLYIISITCLSLIFAVMTREYYTPALDYKPFFAVVPGSILSGAYTTIAKHCLKDENLNKLQYSVTFILIHHAMSSSLPYLNLKCDSTSSLFSALISISSIYGSYYAGTLIGGGLLSAERIKVFGDALRTLAHRTKQLYSLIFEVYLKELFTVKFDNRVVWLGLLRVFVYPLIFEVSILEKTFRTETQLHMDECSGKMAPAYVIDHNKKVDRGLPWYFQEYPLWFQLSLLTLATFLSVVEHGERPYPGSRVTCYAFFISYLSYFSSLLTQSLFKLENRAHYPALTGSMVAGALAPLADYASGGKAVFGQQVFYIPAVFILVHKGLDHLRVCLTVRSLKGCSKNTCIIRLLKLVLMPVTGASVCKATAYHYLTKAKGEWRQRVKSEGSSGNESE